MNIVKEKEIEYKVMGCGVWCHCGHLAFQHTHSCRGRDAGTECEGWIYCKCTCLQCGHRTKYTLQELQRAIDVDRYE